MQLFRKINRILNRNQALVLMYHRVENLYTDPWQLAVSPANFAEQLSILKNEYNVIPVAELLGQVNAGKLAKNSVAITFDDGYADNFIHAAPLLERYGCAATFFITTGSTNQKNLFWWDLLEEIFLKTPILPSALHHGPFNFVLDNNGHMGDDDMNLHKTWSWPQPAPTQRSEIYMAVWQHLKPLPSNEILHYMETLAKWSGVSSINIEQSMPMTEAQLTSLASNKLFCLGVHSVNHLALGFHPENVQHYELENCRNYLSTLPANHANAVAYPYGHYNAETIITMKSLKFDGGFTTEERTVNARSALYQLGRFQVKNWNGTQFKDQLNTWLNY